MQDLKQKTDRLFQCETFKTTASSREALTSEFWVSQVGKLSDLVPKCLDTKNDDQGLFCMSLTQH